MKRTSYALAGLGLAALGLAGCEIVLGLDEREVYNAPVDSGPDQSVGSDAEAGIDVIEEPAPTVCVFPKSKTTGKNAAMRLANFIAGREVRYVDFCMKTHDAASWAGVIPTMRSWGDLCPAGFGYRDVTAQFYMAGGNYDIKLIKAGDTCESEGIATAEQVSIDDNKDNQVIAFGDGSSNNQLKKFLESRATNPSAYKLRFVHAANGKGTYDFGLTGPENKLYITFFEGVGFGSTAKGPGAIGAFSFDANGYGEPQVPAGIFGLGAALSGQPSTDRKAELVRNSGFRTGQAYSVFATGMEGNREFPPQLWTCNDTAVSGLGEMWAQCGDIQQPKDAKFDVFNAQLNGAFAAYESQRRDPLMQAVTDLNSDVICVNEVWSNADKKALADKAKENGWEYSYYAEHDWNTPVDDATDQNGQVPEPFATAPCANSIDKMNASLDCLRDNCIANKDENGSPDATFKDCITPSCGAKALIPLITGTPEDAACWSCIFTQMASYETIAWARDKCATDPKARFVFRGNDGSMVLSRHKIIEPESWVLPATEWRVSVLRTPIEIQPEDATSKTPAVTADFYCSVLTTPVTSCLTRPYTGQYGGKAGGVMDCTKQWEAELLLQTEKLVNYVKNKSSDPRRAIIAGDFYSGQEYTEGENVVLKEAEPVAYQQLFTAFALGAPLDYKPACTFCPPDNAILTPPGSTITGFSTWTSNIFMSAIPITLVQSAETILREGVIDIGYKDGDGGVILAPVSPYFGYRSTLRMYP